MTLLNRCETNMQSSDLTDYWQRSTWRERTAALLERTMTTDVTTKAQASRLTPEQRNERAARSKAGHYRRREE